MSAYEEEGELAECPGCGSEFRVGETCDECGWSLETAEAMAVQAHERCAERVVARPVEPRPFPVHEAASAGKGPTERSDVGRAPADKPRSPFASAAAWCPYCVAWLGTFPSKDEARAYERSLEHHPFEFCARRIAKLNGSEEWRLRHHAGRFGSLAAMKPPGARVPTEADAESGASA